MQIVRTVTVERPVAEVFAYLADFTNTEEWEPATVSTVRESGDGGVGTRYLNTSRFLGRETRLDYVVTGLTAPTTVRLRGENETVVAHDHMELEPTPSGGTTLTYTATFEFKGLARFVGPLASPALWRLGNEAANGLRRALA